MSSLNLVDSFLKNLDSSGTSLSTFFARRDISGFISRIVSSYRDDKELLTLSAVSNTSPYWAGNALRVTSAKNDGSVSLLLAPDIVPLTTSVTGVRFFGLLTSGLIIPSISSISKLKSSSLSRSNLSISSFFLAMEKLHNQLMYVILSKPSRGSLCLLI